MWYIGSFLAGAVVGAVMPVISLRFHLSIPYPFLTLAALMISWSVSLSLTQYGAGFGASLFKGAIAILGRSAAFALGAVGAFYCLMAIYPPNL